jgi:hypothetical protein
MLHTDGTLTVRRLSPFMRNIHRLMGRLYTDPGKGVCALRKSASERYFLALNTTANGRLTL